MAQSSTLKDTFGLQRTDTITDVYLNRLLAALDARFANVEAAQASAQDTAAAVLARGLAILNDTLKPLYDEVAAVAGPGGLGVALNTSSATAVPISVGRAVFFIAAADKDRFVYTGFTQAISAADTRNSLLGRFASYDRAIGALSLDVYIASGDETASPADWIIMPTTPPFVPPYVIDPGSDVQTPLSAVPYVQIQSGATDITELDPGTA